MNLTQMRHFLALVDTLNFTAAAKASGVTQPTLTRSIQRLEEQLGGRLVHRDGNDTRLTTLGRAVRGEFEVMLRSDDRIRALAQENRYGNLDKLTIGVAGSVAPMRFARFFKKMLRSMPMVEMVIHPITTRTGVELVLAGTLDGCFITDAPHNNPKLSVIDLFSERLLLGFATGHRLAAHTTIPRAELAGETYIDRLNCEFRERVAALWGSEVEFPPARLRSEREDWLQDVVASGGGVTFVPEHSVIVSGMELRAVEGVDLGREVSFVSVSGSGSSKVLIEFREQAKREEWG